MSVNCPNCRLINPDGTQRCDCGYDFESRTIKPSLLVAEQSKKVAAHVQNLIEAHGGVEAALRDVGRRNMIRGACWFVGGLLVTGATYSVAVQQTQTGGRSSYMVAWGAVVFGALQFFRGVSQYRGQGSISARPPDA